MQLDIGDGDRSRGYRRWRQIDGVEEREMEIDGGVEEMEVEEMEIDSGVDKV